VIRSVRGRGRNRGTPEIQIAPMIDLMFTLLIFFVVTNSFVRETGLEVQRPRAGTATEADPNSILVGIGPLGEVYFEGRRVELLGLRTLVEQRLARRRDAGVVLVADRRTPTEALVQVMDEAHAAGATRVAIASRRERP
jgi:biopolymer transport protein ExbD